MVNGDKMDNIKRNEIKQAIKSKINEVLQEELILIFNDYTITGMNSKRIINDICLWANIVLDNEIN